LASDAADRQEIRAIARELDEFTPSWPDERASADELE
jgi:hypothetical protein